MPGPSGLPNTLASYGAELQSAMGNSTSSQHSLDPGSPASGRLEAETTCSDKLPDCVAMEAGMPHPEVSPQPCLISKRFSAAKSCAGLHHPAAKGYPNPGLEGNLAEPAGPVVQEQSAQGAFLLNQDEVQAPPLMIAGASGHRPQLPAVLSAASAPNLVSSSLQAAEDVASGDAVPTHSQHTAANPPVGASTASPTHQLAVMPAGVANETAASMHSQHAAAAPPGATNVAPPTHSHSGAATTAGAADDSAPSMHRQLTPPDVTPDTSCMLMPADEDTTIPDSACPMQHGCHTDNQCQAMLTKPPASSHHSQPTSDNASLEAALALAALASGEKRPPAARPQDCAAEKAEVPTGRGRQRPHQQCASDRAPLRTIQRGAAIQRRPLKPAWQHSGRAEPSWDGKGQRTRPLHPSKLSHRVRTPTRRNRDAKNAHSGDSKQGNSGTAVAVGGSEAGSQCASDQIDASKQSQSTGVPPASMNVGAQASSRGRMIPLSSKPTGRRQHGGVTKDCAEDETRLGPEVRGKQMAVQQQLQHTRLDGDALGKDIAAADGDDDDDFKPDVRRRPKSHQSPKGSGKRAKQLPLPGAGPGSALGEVGAGAHANAVGQVLLSWDEAQRCWQHRIITACNANQVRRSVCLEHTHDDGQITVRMSTATMLFIYNMTSR